MSRFLDYGTRFLGQPAFVGRGRPVLSPVGTSIDATLYEGAVIYGSDGVLYYSDGVQWKIPTETVDIARPTALPPTNSDEARKLRLTNFFSPRGLTQTGVFFQVAETADGFDNPLFERDFNSVDQNEYETIYPGDGLVPGQVFWWRALYRGTEGSQSEFSVPFRQVYPDLIDDPRPVTAEGATSGAVELTAYNSAFGLSYVETQIELWAEGSDPDVDPPLETVTAVTGASTTLPDSLQDGAAYLWRGRYGGRVGGAGPITYTDWSNVQTVLNGAASMILVFDPVKAQNRTITLPIGVYGGLVDVLIDWGDGSTQSVQSGGNVNHTYATGDDTLKVVTISGQLEQYGGNVNIQGLIRVDNIGFKLGLTSLREMFRNCTTNTTYVNPALPPQVTNGYGMFWEADPGFDVGALVMSNIQNFERMFYNSDFNGPLPWDTSGATNMREMFYGYQDRTKFNNPSIGNWDVSNVTNFQGMFIRNAVFNQSLANWDTSSATNMSYMFGSNNKNSSINGGNHNGGGLFQYGVQNWNVLNVTDFSYMFGDSDTFNGRYWNEDISGWNTSSAVTIEGMFNGAREFNQNLSNWNVSNVQSFNSVLRSASSFAGSVSGWNTGNGTDFTYMFASANPTGLENFDVTGATSLAYMLGSCPFSGNLNNWDVSGITDFEGIFASAGNPVITGWDTSSATNMSFMFHRNSDFNQDISGWDTSNVTNMEGMFYNNSTTPPMIFNRPIELWDVSNVSDFSNFMSTRYLSRSGLLDRDFGSWELNTSGVSMSRFTWESDAWSTENYSRTLVGWANGSKNRDGPFSTILETSATQYNSVVYDSGGYVTNAVDARAFLTRSRRVLVASASTADADGDFLWNGTTQQFEKANGWHFFDNGTAWELRDDTDTVQATAQDTTMPDQPYKVATWDGVLSSATVDLNGMGWTITDGGAV